jgi:hypothetical protein
VTVFHVDLSSYLGLSLVSLVLVVPEQRQQDDDGNGNAQQPKKHASTKAHVDLRLPQCGIRRVNALMRITVPCLKTFSRHWNFAQEICF